MSPLMSDKNHDISLAGAVILFHPTAEVIQNISSYIDELVVLYIIDNSISKNEKLLSEIKAISPKCKLISNSENLGIASALNQAVEIACNEGHDWLLTMDQDSHFTDNAFFKAFNEFENKEEVSLFAPELVVFQKEYIKGKKISFKIVRDMLMTSGNIINLKTCNQIGRFEKKLFIDEVDTDYCFKLLKNKFTIIQIEGSYLFHPLGYIKKVDLPLGFKKQIVEHHPFRHYYISRNSFYILKNYIAYLPKIVLRRWKEAFLKKTIYGILFHKNRWRLLKFTIMGICDFVRNRYGVLKQK